MVPVGDMTVPPFLVASGEGLRTDAEPIDGVRARGETGMHDMERRREWPTDLANFGSIPCKKAEI